MLIRKQVPALLLQPAQRSIFKTYTGHTFGTILNNSTTGCGTLRIASSGYFPTGDWSTFLGSAGGTVEYYQTAASATITLPATNTNYYNLITSPYDGKILFCRIPTSRSIIILLQDIPVPPQQLLSHSLIHPARQH